MNRSDTTDPIDDDGSPSTPPTRPRPQRPRISILTVLFFVAFCAIAIALSGLEGEKYRIQRRLIEFHDATGELVILHPGRLAAAQKPRFRDEQIWEVYLPPGHAFDLRLATEQISDSGTPPSFETVSLSPGRHEIELVQEGIGLLRDDRPDHVDVRVLVDGRVAIAVRKAIHWKGNMQSFFNGPNANRLEHPPDQPLTLLRTTFHTHLGGRISTSRGPADGILLWIQPR